MPRLSICLNPDDPNENYENENLDFCRKCYMLLTPDKICEALHNLDKKLVERAYGDNYAKDAGAGSEHPDYSDTGYVCEICRIELTDDDN